MSCVLSGGGELGGPFGSSIEHRPGIALQWHNRAFCAHFVDGCRGRVGKPVSPCYWGSQIRVAVDTEVVPVFGTVVFFADVDDRMA